MIERPGGDADGKTAWRRPDASMSLLADLLAGKLLEPGYEEAAARRRAAGEAGPGPGRPGRQRNGGVLLVVILVGVLLAVAGAEVRRSEPVAQQQRSRLIDEIRARTSDSDALQGRVDRLRAETERLRAAALARSDTGRRTREDLARVSAAAAATPVSGGGLKVTLDDAKGGDEEHGEDDGRVYDQDLQVLVNGLWGAGATAIAVNGLRVTPTTAIRSAGEAILVDYRPLTRPYEVTAIGDRERLAEAFGDSAAAAYLRALKNRFGLRLDQKEERRLRLRAGTVPLQLRHARPDEGRETPG